MRTFSLVILAFLFSVACHARIVKPAHSEYGIFFSEMLPSQVPGIADIMPFSGLHYGHGWGNGTAEGNVAVSNANGSTYDLFSAGYRGDVFLDKGFSGFVNGGIELHYFNTPTRATPVPYGGIYVGTGVLIALTQSLWLHAGMNFNLQPGLSLMINYGLDYRAF